ncbi:MAG: bifunctional isocitrate dehydrogenase kinase/phosphatase [Burkholderiaceae bacterium]|nr:bifunctional isocitrate dehydrogenase kinase/phosphatase [Burkholderiaceae bacterium]
MQIERVDAPQAPEIARVMIEGFNRHYALFRNESQRAKYRFETRDWHGQRRAQRDRIEFYDLRVHECSLRLEREFKAHTLPMQVWQQVKLLYIGLLVEHHQPELAETFFNSVTTRILNHEYFQNDFIFVRPVISTEYMEIGGSNVPLTFRAYYPSLERQQGLEQSVQALLEAFGLSCPFEDLPRDALRVADAMRSELGGDKLRANFQIQVLASLFFRNKAAYVVGKLCNGFRDIPFVLALLHRKSGADEKAGLYVDAALFGEEDLLLLFSFARAYFLVDMETPSTYVHFLRSLMPRKTRAELYNALGLAKQGKNLFYRDFLYHLRHSSDKFRIAPGIKGMVMLVFDLPSFPYVFKVIKDFYPPQKETTRELIEEKYQLVKRHDRVGRMADTQEFSLVAFPLARFEDDLVQELRQFAPSQVEISDRDGDGQVELILKHVYIERRMIPLNLYLQEAFDAGDADPVARQQMERAIVEYGNAIKEMVAANIFPGDMLWKNFGVTRQGKVVFYDYDEIEYITDCNFRKVPPPRCEEDEMSGEVWYAVGKNDVFPETFAPFLLGSPRVREIFMRYHADLLDTGFWQANKERIGRGELIDVFPYAPRRRFGAAGADSASGCEAGENRGG